MGILWLFGSMFCVGLYPLWEGRHTMKRTGWSIWLDLTGKDGRGYAQRGREEMVIEGSEKSVGLDGKVSGEEEEQGQEKMGVNVVEKEKL